MSIVIAIRCNNKIYLGADTQATKGQIKERTSKIWKVEHLKNSAFGWTGSLRNSQLVKYAPGIITEFEEFNGIDTRFVVLNLFDRVYELFRLHGIVPKEDKEPRELNDEFIFACKDNAWVISYDGSVTEIDDYLCIGSGSDVALGVLETNKGDDPKTRIEKAIKASSDKTLYVNSYIEIIET